MQIVIDDVVQVYGRGTIIVVKDDGYQITQKVKIFNGDNIVVESVIIGIESAGVRCKDKPIGLMLKGVVKEQVSAGMILDYSNLGVDKLVEKIIQLYYENDYDYVVSLAKKNKRPSGLSNIEEALLFIKNNNLNTDNLSENDLKIVSEIMLKKIKEIDKEEWDKYN